MTLRKIIQAFIIAIPVGLFSYAAQAKNIVDTASSNPNLKTLVTALKAADLVDTLKGKGPFTVFAPSDAAFAKLPAGTLANLLKPENKAQLVKILTYHVVASKITSSDVKSKMADPKTVLGQTLHITKSGKVVKINGVSTVVTADIVTDNGVIHVIDTVLMPK